MNDMEGYTDPYQGIEMPRDLSAEQAVLGSILLDPDVIGIVTERLQGGEFYNKSNSRIFRAMTKIHKDEKPIDVITLSSYLQESEELEKIGGPQYLAQLASITPTAAHVEQYTEIVADMFLKREAITMAMALVNHASKGEDTREFVAKAEAALSKLSDKSAPAKEFVKLRNVLIDVFEEQEKLFTSGGDHEERSVTGVASGFADLDGMTAGFQKDDLIIVAARPSVGKTAFALNIAQNVGVRAKETVAIFSLEMSDKQLTKRMICAEVNIDASRMRSGRFEGDDWERMGQAVGILGEAPIFIDDTPGITIGEIRAKCRRLKKQSGLGLVLIDYLQLITYGRRGVNRQEAVSEISRQLKQMARELEVPVIALSQLSRSVEQRANKRPMMSDLRESGSLEQDADIVAFLYRDDYYDKQSEKKNIIEIIIAKQRNGPVGTVELAFMKQFNKFVGLDRSHQSTGA